MALDPARSTELLHTLLSHVAPHVDLSPLDNAPALTSALLQLVNSQPAQQGERDRLVAEQKVGSLRTSMAHLTSHLTLLSERLAVSESTLSSLKLLHRRDLERVEEERDALRALCGVWEGRWREERRLREEQELLNSSKSGRALNDRRSRMETTLSLTKPITPPISRSRRSSSASSSSSSSDVTHLTTSHSSKKRHPSYPGGPAGTTTSSTTPRLRTRQVVADLARELERVRREADRLLFERDEEITRLEADQSLRRREMADLYRSLDTLLGLGGHVNLRAPQDVTLPPDTPIPEQPRATHSRKGKEREHTRTGSILDLPAVRAAAAHSRASGETAALEEEVRELEREIARMGGGQQQDQGADSSSCADATSGSELPPDGGDDELRLTIQELNAQVAQLRHDLEEARNERAAMRAAMKQSHDGRPPNSTLPSHVAPSTLRHLEEQRDRLAQLLANAEAANASLNTELHTTRSHFEDVSERVRLKLVEQKAKLEACYQEMEALGDALEESEKQVVKERARRKEVEALWAGLKSGNR